MWPQIYFIIAYYLNINTSSFRGCLLREAASDSVNAYVIGDNKTAYIYIVMYIVFIQNIGVCLENNNRKTPKRQRFADLGTVAAKKYYNLS